VKKAKGISRSILILACCAVAVRRLGSAGRIRRRSITLTWASDPTTTQTITWRTDTIVASGVVQYYTMNGRTVNPTVTVSAPANKTLNSDLGDMYLHSVTLTGLVPAYFAPMPAIPGRAENEKQRK
jgi:hypothetical protein